ncbi:MAG: ABC transporter permease [Candidatus Aminicenantes bacterium]|nr:ABC transporter permease [Candidatus Aminicenantes bacterium]
MIGNYLKVTFRTLLKHKVFSIVNIAGLALSMSICLMIIIFIKDQKSSDGFHEKRDRIVRVYTTDRNIEHSEVKGWATTPGSLAPYLVDNVPCVEDVVRVRRMDASVLKTETALTISGMYAEPSFFRIFSFPLKDGDPETALNHPNSIVISGETAHKFFGDEDPMNKTLTLENLGDFMVTGVLRDSDQKSHFRFDALVSFATLPSLENKGTIKESVNSWSSFNRYYTYVLLRDADDQSVLEDQLPAIANTLVPEQERETFGFKLQPLAKINLGINLANCMPGTKHSFEYVFIPFLAVLVIFLACFNYIILSIARSLKRTKEIGLRKVIGARRSQIIKLFLSETFAVTFLALAAACLFILWLIPAFNGIDAVETTNMQINLELMKDPGLYIIFVLFALGVSVLAGLYPALYLSSFQPVNALQGVSRIKGFSRLLTRKILMGIQFAVSLTSVIFIAYLYQLHTYWMTFDRGMKTEHIVNVILRDVNSETLRNEIITNSNITGVSFSSSIPIFGGFHRPGLRTEKMDEPRRAFYYSVDTEFIHNFEIDLIAGRNFSRQFSTDSADAVIINEKAVQVLDLGSPVESIGKTLVLGKDSEVTVIGVVKDFNFRLLENPIDPLALRYQPQEFRYANIGYAPGKKEEIKAWLSDTWKKLDKIHPIQYVFMEDMQERHESQIGGTIRISAWASGFVILIALFGLLGMATYTAEMRVKEIGIRKVLGASVSGMAYLLSKDYIRLIVVSAVFALPAGYFLSGSMMQFFAFRPGLSLWVLPGALAFVLALALVTIGSQTVRAALANPIETLREE